MTYLPVTIRLYGRNMVEVRKGAKSIHLNTFTEGEAGAEQARRFAGRVASAIGCGVEDELDTRFSGARRA